MEYLHTLIGKEGESINCFFVIGLPRTEEERIVTGGFGCFTQKKRTPTERRETAGQGRGWGETSEKAVCRPGFQKGESYGNGDGGREQASNG